MTRLYQKASARLPAIREKQWDARAGRERLFDVEPLTVRDRYVYRPPVPPGRRL